MSRICLLCCTYTSIAVAIALRLQPNETIIASMLGFVLSIRRSASLGVNGEGAWLWLAQVLSFHMMIG